MLLGDLPSLGVKRTTEDVKYVMNKFWTALDEDDVLNPTLYAHSNKSINEILARNCIVYRVAIALELPGEATKPVPRMMVCITAARGTLITMKCSIVSTY